ncbi:MAG: nucleoside triphosphate pyrophosphohydrolase [Treponema sp.]|jgi:tetrapyrrole methylase family protein/MazG family protein|nr:nucleoside triphosphate pyrophosphohydrolase [Treponema sp.]
MKKHECPVAENMRGGRHTDGGAAFERLCGIVARLRAPGGCPWDREQSPESLRGDLVEETYECVEAINAKEPGHIMEELGDLFLLVTMLSFMHEQEGAFTVADVLEGVSAKLVRRHPHVFGDVKVKDSTEVLDNWARIKVEQEGRIPKDSMLDEVSRGLPPLDRAFRLQKKAARAGFDWPDLAGVTGKMEEELNEVREAAAVFSGRDAAGNDGADDTPAGEDAFAFLEGELGDLLFSAVNLCRFLGMDPSVALHRTNVKFDKRFRHVEKRMKETGAQMKKENLAVMDTFWEEAKKEGEGIRAVSPAPRQN